MKASIRSEASSCEGALSFEATNEVQANHGSDGSTHGASIARLPSDTARAKKMSFKPFKSAK